ncbi:transcriptional regulator, LysR family [Rhodoferax ferrireducens T118]|uniref:Transcriptional regulator, LysR family n=1 Tax=Albidiferax ferrireducens (strain ATCC BAA-621 / DSM 15236 / T118) TaxID=338969 RepID=Q21VF3_ALBFT|nr:LysR family transcriptional regulator [Rhodoferax ferrireducens]ABD70250.1 transcriptional regulator, LysR family [Rhodoferax ferrireducens T118]WPC65412.1 LysR family transcriptional regulator [Rhodoferax ferrireducens]
MDRFLEMQTFNAVVDAGSFVKAADALGMSKAAVSRYVVDMETRLGVRLLHRTTRRLSLTDEGQIFYVRSKELLAELAEAEDEITSRSDAASGLLRINAPFTFGVLHLAPLWGAFRVRHPNVKLDVTLADRLVDLVEEGYDVAIRIANLENSTLVSKRLATTRMVLCASPQYLKLHGTPKHPGELADHAVISYSYWSTKDEWPFKGPLGPVSVKTNPCIHTNNGDTCRAAALASQGIILQPSFLVGDDLASGALVELMPEFRSLELGIYAVYPSRKHVSPKVRALIDFLTNHFSQPGMTW